jgi:hypothetical protein
MISSEDAKSGLREFVIGIVTLEQVAITSVKVRAAPLAWQMCSAMHRCMGLTCAAATHAVIDDHHGNC